MERTKIYSKRQTWKLKVRFINRATRIFIQFVFLLFAIVKFTDSFSSVYLDARSESRATLSPKIMIPKDMLTHDVMSNEISYEYSKHVS